MTIGGLTLSSDLPVYVLTQKTDADGKPDSSSPVNVYSAKLMNGAVEITLPAGDMRGSGCAVAIVQPTTDYGSVVINGPETLKEVSGAASYDVPYTAAYTMSENLKSMINQGKDSITDESCSFTFVVQLDHRLTAKTGTQDYTFTSPIFEIAQISGEGSTLTVTCKLKDDWKEHIGELTATPMILTSAGVLKAENFTDADVLMTTGSIEVDALSQSITIPANICQTMMVKQKTFTVTFDSAGGSAVKSQTVTEGQTVAKPNDPTREGYKFDGWYLNDGKWDFGTPVTNNITLTAHWTENSSGESGGGTTNYLIEASAGTGGTISPAGKVWVSRGSDKTFTIAPAKGYVLSSVLVDGKDVGTAGTYTFENVRSGHTIAASFAKDMTDPENTGVADWLDTVTHGRYFHGYEDDTFRPDRPMTRAEAAQMFYNLLRNKDVPVTVSFEDVPAEAWYAKAVGVLASLEKIEGVGQNRFSPERAITRAEFTTIAMRFANGIPAGENTFSDVSPDDWFYDQVVGAIQYGWINGYEDETFRPNHTITRAEVTAITNRMLGRSADKDYVDQHAEALHRFPDVPATYWAYYSIAEAANAHDYTKDGSGEHWKDHH